MDFVNNSWFDAQFQRTLGHASMGGADLGECFSLLPLIKNSTDFNVWYQAWFGLAETLASQAQAYAALEQNYSAYCAYLRASNYYRTSYFFLDENPADKRILTAYDLSVKTFELALKNSSYNYQIISIPFQDTHFPGFLFFPKVEAEKNYPLMIDTGGGDATKEELFFSSSLAAIKRGYASLIFDGPGQGAMLRKHNMLFRPDWEVVIKAVVDYVESVCGIDQTRLVLLGSSFGGYLAPRAVTVEKRIATCIANPGILNASATQDAGFPAPIKRAMRAGDDGVVNLFFDKLSRKDKMKSFLFESRKVRFGAKTVAEMFRAVRHYEIESRVKK